MITWPTFFDLKLHAIVCELLVEFPWLRNEKNPLGEIVSDKIAPNAVMQKGQGFKSYEPVNTTWVW